MKVKRITALMLAVVMVVGVLCATTVTASAAGDPLKVTVRYLNVDGTLYYAKTYTRPLGSPSGTPYVQLIGAIKHPKDPTHYVFSGWKIEGKTYKANAVIDASKKSTYTATPIFKKR